MLRIYTASYTGHLLIWSPQSYKGAVRSLLTFATQSFNEDVTIKGSNSKKINKNVTKTTFYE